VCMLRVFAFNWLVGPLLSRGRAVFVRMLSTGTLSGFYLFFIFPLGRVS
jgi:hypothetical protein